MPYSLQTFLGRCSIRSRSIFALNVTRLHDITFLTVRTERAESEVCRFRYLDRTVILRRFQSRDAAIRCIMDFNTWIKTGNCHCTFTDKCICVVESFQVRHTVIYIHDIQTRELLYQSFFKSIPAFYGRIAPGQFCQCHHTGHNHILYPFAGWDIFAPEICLHTQNQCFLCIIQRFKHRIVIVYTRQ